MTSELDRMLAAAADDTDRPLHTDVNDLLVQARRSVRRTRIATASTAVLTTAAVVAGVAAWSANRPESYGPAGTPVSGRTVTVDVKTGRIIDNETGATVVPAPAVSPLSDDEARSRCQEAGNQYRRTPSTVKNSTGPLDSRWTVVAKSGDRSTLSALFLSPNRSVVTSCYAAPKQSSVASYPTTQLYPQGRNHLPWAEEIGLRIAKPGVAHVLLDMVGEKNPREARLGTDGFFTHDQLDAAGHILLIARIRAYDAQGRKIYEQVIRPQPGLGTSAVPQPNVTLKVAAPVAPDVVLTKDPLTGKPLAPPPPVSPLSDEQVTTRCRSVDDIYRQGSGHDQQDTNAGPVTKDWQVALKTGTGDKLTAVLISPDRKVFAWCHMLTPTAKGAYDYTRGVVQANGRFRSAFEFLMVPDGVAQLVVDLPTQGPTRALISNGFYIWGLTGGNSNLKRVRIRGYDAHGRQIYAVLKTVDVDFD